MLEMTVAGGASFILSQTLLPKPAFGATPDLSVVKGPSPAACVREAVQSLGGMGRFVSKGDVVVIKPNMGFGNPRSNNATTDPDVVRALAELALQAGAKRILVFDNPCHNPKIVLEVSGIKDRLTDLHDTFVFIIKEERFFRQVTLPKAQVLKTSEVSIDILEADVIINVPVAKAHSSALVTFGMKNWMGVVKNRKPFHAWLDMHQAIADIASYIKPKLTVLDATRALVTNGPGGPGKILNLQTIVAGTDPVAIDAYATTLAPWDDKGYRPDQIPYIVKAAKMGLGQISLDKLNIVTRTL